MGKHIREGTDSCWDYTPDDSDTEMYLNCDFCSNVSMQEILDKAKEKWPEATLENLHIEPKYIHTHAIYYDRYDPSDYTHYLLVTLNK